MQLSTNPNDIKVIFAKKGILLSQNEFEELKKSYTSNLYLDIKKNANKEIYINQAKKNAENFIKTMLLSLGFKDVEIIFANNQ